MTGFAGAFGISRFAYSDFRGRERRRRWCSRPIPRGRARHYLSQRYQEIDPVVTRMRSSLMPSSGTASIRGAAARASSDVFLARRPGTARHQLRPDHPHP